MNGAKSMWRIQPFQIRNSQSSKLTRVTIMFAPGNETHFGPWQNSNDHHSKITYHFSLLHAWLEYDSGKPLQGSFISLLWLNNHPLSDKLFALNIRPVSLFVLGTCAVECSLVFAYLLILQVLVQKWTSFCLYTEKCYVCVVPWKVQACSYSIAKGFLFSPDLPWLCFVSVCPHTHWTICPGGQNFSHHLIVFFASLHLNISDNHSKGPIYSRFKMQRFYELMSQKVRCDKMRKKLQIVVNFITFTRLGI